MIRIETETGTHYLDADPEDVNTTGQTLTVTVKGTVIGKFRKWVSYSETTQTNER